MRNVARGSTATKPTPAPRPTPAAAILEALAKDADRLVNEWAGTRVRSKSAPDNPAPDAEGDA